MTLLIICLLELSNSGEGILNSSTIFLLRSSCSYRIFFYVFDGSIVLCIYFNASIMGANFLSLVELYVSPLNNSSILFNVFGLVSWWYFHTCLLLVSTLHLFVHIFILNISLQTCFR